MKVRVFDYEHKDDFEITINEIVVDKNIIDIKYSISHFLINDEQFFSFS